MNNVDPFYTDEDDTFEQWLAAREAESLAFRQDHPGYDDADERRFLAQHGLTELPF